MTLNFELRNSINSLKISIRKRITLPEKVGQKSAATSADLLVPKDQNH